jgi:Glycosyl hydrolase family 53
VDIVPRGKRTLAAAVALAALLVPAAAADAARTVPPGFYGSVYGGNVELAPAGVQTQLWNKLAEGGAESARVLFNWDWAQRAQPHGPFDWSKIDPLVMNAVKRGMSILPIVEYAPGWAKRYPTRNSSPPRDVNDYTAFLRACIERYGPRPALFTNKSFWWTNPTLPYKPIREWEIWNEPEIAFHWYREPFKRPWQEQDAKAYVKLLKASYTVVHQADPGAKVVLAALSIDSWKNLRRFYDWTDIEGKFDVAAIQAYSGSTSFIPTLMRNFRQVLNNHGAKNIPMYVTEMTWPAAKGKSNPHYTTGYMSGFITDRQTAAKRLTEGYKILRGMRSELKLQRVYWYTGVSSYKSANEYEYSGLLNFQNGKVLFPPVFGAYQKSARAAEGCAKDSNGVCK